MKAEFDYDPKLVRPRCLGVEMTKQKAKISKMPAPTKRGSIWLVHLPGDFFDSGFAHYEQARQFVADWVDGKVR